MRYFIAIGGQRVIEHDKPITANIGRDCFVSGRNVWFDPRPSQGATVESEEDAAPVPQRVSMAQARIALSRAGISESAVDAVINAMPDGQAKTEAGIWWRSSNEVWRTSATVAALAPALSLDAGDLDALFTAASAIEA